MFLTDSGLGPVYQSHSSASIISSSVVVVFDQLPLASLLTGAGDVDRALYPHFAALSDNATWFRNASAVSESTTVALPAIVTGNYPTPGQLPVAADYPANLFTLFGTRYRLHVHEPLVPAPALAALVSSCVRRGCAPSTARA